MTRSYIPSSNLTGLQGTPKYIARSVSLGKVLIDSDTLLADPMPELSEEAKNLYIKAYGEDRYQKYAEDSDFSWSQLLGALVMINARLFRALVNAPSNIGHSCFPRLLAALPLASHRRCGRSRRSPAHRCGALALPRPMAARRRFPAAASLLPF